VFTNINYVVLEDIVRGVVLHLKLAAAGALGVILEQRIVYNCAVVGSTGFGNGTRSGSNAGVVGRVASAGIPGTTNTAPTGNVGRVASAGIPAMQAVAPTRQMQATPMATNLEVLSKPPVQYPSEAKQLKVQGDVVLRVTFTAAGHVVVQGIIHGLGHGLDEEARRVAQQIRFRPATRNGQSVDTTTNITISFQLA